MRTPHLVVVGASLAGLRAVETARRAGYDGAITLVGAEPHLPYDRTVLSKGFLTESADLRFLSSADSLRREFEVEVRLGTRATALDLAGRTVVLDDGEIGYTALVIATGAMARELPGAARLPGVHHLRGVEDALAIRNSLRPGIRVVIIGSGFVGSEVACSARQLGAEVTLVEAAPVPLVRAVGEVMGAACARLHERAGNTLRCGTAVESIEGDGRVTVVRLADGSTLTADLVVVGVGAVPAVDWLDGAGLQLDDGVVCDQTLGTGAPGVYAAGDVARWYHPGYGQTMRVEHWTSAAEQGAIAARNATALGRPQPCTSVPYFWSDWNRDRIQFVGVPEADEVRVVAGDPDSGSFLALYRRGDRVTGALGVNRRRQVAKLRVMMAGGASWSQGRELASAPEAA